MGERVAFGEVDSVVLAWFGRGGRMDGMGGRMGGAEWGRGFLGMAVLAWTGCGLPWLWMWLSDGWAIDGCGAPGGSGNARAICGVDRRYVRCVTCSIRFQKKATFTRLSSG